MSAPAFFQNARGKADIKRNPRFHELPFCLISTPYPKFKKHNPRFQKLRYI